MIEVYINSNGKPSPEIEELSLVMIDKKNNFDLGIISFKDEVEIFDIGNLLELNPLFYEDIRNSIKIEGSAERLFLVNKAMIRQIFGELDFFVKNGSNTEYLKECVLIDEGMLSYGEINGDDFSDYSSNINYKYVKAFIYALIETHNEHLLELDGQVIVELPEELFKKCSFLVVG